MAKSDKERYKTEMKDYTPPDDSDDDDGGGKKKPKKKRAKKDPNAPKRGLTSFFLFSSEMRPKIKEQYPDMAFGDIGKKLGELFKELSPEEKAKYDEKAAKDKQRYADEMKAYESKKAVDDGVDDDDNDDDSD